VIFHKEDALLIPFSLMWGGFAIFWESSVLAIGGHGVKGAPPFFVLWGIPFVIIGQYLIWGRFLYAWWLKNRTYYAVTNQRVLVVQNSWKRQMASAYIDSLPTVLKEGNRSGTGTLRFAQAVPISGRSNGWGAWNSLSVGGVPTFLDIDDVDYVYRLVSDLREKTRSKNQPDF
jgi:hypothetical protein